MRKTLLAVGLFAFTLCAHPQDDMSKRIKIRELFTLMHMQQRVELTKAMAMQSTQDLAKRNLDALDLPKPQANITARYYEKINAVVVQLCDWQKLEPRYEQVYADLYTEEEIDGALAFYKSPPGQAWLAKNPEVTQRVSDVLKEQISLIAPQVQQLTKELMGQLKAAEPSR